MESEQLREPDYSQIIIGDTFKCRIRSFNIEKGFYIGYFKTENFLVSAIIGKTTDIGISDIFLLKQNIFQLTYHGLRPNSTTGKDYPKWTVVNLGHN
jgi:hypothetical protein